MCPSCGNLRSECSDPDRLWYPQRDVCYATAAELQVKRRLAKKHKPVAHDDPEPHAMDGVHIWASLDDLTPDDDFI